MRRTSSSPTCKAIRRRLQRRGRGFHGRLQSDFGGFVLHRFDNRLGLEEFHFADLGIELRLDLALMAEGLLRRRDHGILQSADEDRFVDAFFLTHLFDNSIEILLHIRHSNHARNWTFRLLKWNFPARAVLIERDPLRRDFQQAAEKRAPPANRLTRAHPDSLADKMGEMLGALERRLMPAKILRENKSLR